MPSREATPLIDWFEVVIDLRRHGFGVTRIAAALNVPRQTVERWAYRGAEPGFSNGHRLLALWAAIVQREPPRRPFAITLPQMRHRGNALAAN